MEEQLLEIMEHIANTLDEINSKIPNNAFTIDDIYGKLIDIENELISSDINTIDDVHGKLEEISEHLSDIKGNGLYNSISDVNEKLDEVNSNLLDLDTSVSTIGL